MPEARFWTDALELVASEMRDIVAEILANVDCDAVGSVRKARDLVPDSELRLLGFEDVVV